MKYKNRTEQRKVTETLSAILLPLIDHLNNDDADAVKKALEILNNTDIEAEDKRDCTTCIGLENADYERWFCHDCIKGIQNHYKLERGKE